MEKDQTIIQQLVDGINPLTGELLEDNHICKDDKVVQALINSILALDKEEKRLERKERLPKNAGKSWLEEENEKLVLKFDEGCTIEELVIM